ncbi:MAG: phosphomevalonate kinase, partial [Candidatus Diapherotrites archaeon]|nr:phosphomevalonate kinase [Candidatus Diapherotrites archaeon]
DGSAKKVGFGSSAAATVAIVSSLLASHGVDISTPNSKKKIFKLSAFSHYEAQGKIGSCFDIAASTYGGLLKYSRFDPDWLIEQTKSKSLTDLINSKWKGLGFEEILIKSEDLLSVCWTKSSASTVNLVKEVYKLRDSNPVAYKELMSAIVNANKRVFNSWLNNRSELLDAMKENELALKQLGEKAGVEIETSNLKLLIETAEQFGCPAKLSGAGGGDCGFAVVPDSDTAKKLTVAWTNAGLFPLDVALSKDGVKTN